MLANERNVLARAEAARTVLLLAHLAHSRAVGLQASRRVARKDRLATIALLHAPRMAVAAVHVAAAAAPFIFVCSSVAAILSLAERIAIVLNPTKPPQPPVSVAMRTRETYDGWVPLLTLFGLLGSVPSSVSTSSGAAREAIWLWLISWLVGSFYFMAITTVTHNQERNWVDEKRMAANIWRRDATYLLGKDAVNMTKYTPQQDWGARQLQVSTDIALPWILGGDSRRGDPIRGMWLIFLHEQCLLHLFPTVDHSRLPALREVTRRTCREFGVPFPEPEPYGTLYLGMMRALAGMQVGRALAS